MMDLTIPKKENLRSPDQLSSIACHLQGRNAVVYVDSIIEIARYMYKNII